jgi:Fur family ferric uptake transcriptional regulator
MDRLEDLCRERGVRLTEQRRIVLEVLEAATDHPCTFEIHRRASVGRRIGVATVYRALNSLATAGVITRHIFRDGKARYERAGKEAHPHLIDVASGAVVELDDKGDLARMIEEEALRMGFRLVEFRLKLFGEKS